MARSMAFLGLILLITTLGTVVCQIDFVPENEDGLSQQQPEIATASQEGVDTDCLFCKLLAAQVQTYIQGVANATEETALNYTATECATLVEKLHLPDLVCSEITPLIKSELDSFKGSIIDFFDPDTVCTAIKLCDEDGPLSREQRLLFDQMLSDNRQKLASLQSTYHDNIECDLCHAVIDAIKQNLSAYDTGVAQEIAGKVNGTCLDFITEFKIPTTACDDIYDALFIIIMALEVDLADFLSDNVCILAGICTEEEDHSLPDANTVALAGSTDEEESIQCTLCKALAGDVQQYVETEANATEAAALNYTEIECDSLADQLHLPESICSLVVVPEIKAKLDEYKGSLDDFFAPDYLCPLIKLCPENSTLAVPQEEFSLQTLPSKADGNGLNQMGGSVTCVLCEVVVDALVQNISAYGEDAMEEALSDVNNFCLNIVTGLDLPVSICDDVTDAVRIIFVTYSGDVSSFLSTNLCPLIGACPQDSDMVSARPSSKLLRSSRGDLDSPREHYRGPDAQAARPGSSLNNVESSGNDAGGLIPCTLCELVVDSLDSDISSYENQTIANILAYTNTLCGNVANTLKLPVSEFCADINDAISKVLVSVEGKIDNFVTKNLCSLVGLCPDTPGPTPGPEPVSPPSSSPSPSPPPSPPQPPPARETPDETDGSSTLASWHHSILGWTVVVVVLTCFITLH